MSEEDRDRQAAITLKAAGLTVISVIVSVGTTVGFGLTAPWWVRVLAGVGTTLGLIVLVKLGSGARRGPLARLANWVIGAPSPSDGR